MIMLRNTALAVFFVLATTAPLVVDASRTIPACYSYSDLDINVEPDQCNDRYIIEHFLLPAYEIRKAAAASGTFCRGGVWNDIMAMTGTTNKDDARKKINLFCEKRRERTGRSTTTTAPLETGVTNSIPDPVRKTITACYDYSDLDIEVAPNQCNDLYIIENYLLPAYEVRQAAAASGSGSDSGTFCKGGAWNDIMALTGTTDIDDAQKKINLFCKTRRERTGRSTCSANSAADGATAAFEMLVRFPEFLVDEENVIVEVEEEGETAEL